VIFEIWRGLKSDDEEMTACCCVVVDGAFDARLVECRRVFDATCESLVVRCPRSWTCGITKFWKEDGRRWELYMYAVPKRVAGIHFGRSITHGIAESAAGQAVHSLS
jgi:hypothetical protein